MVEVGPGPGGLTRALLDTAAASVTVIEVDDRAVAIVREMAETAGGRLNVIAGDALRMDLTTTVPAPRHIVANLPYNIASPLLVGWLRQGSAWERLTLMFQLEVAERICAAPGTGAYGRLSVLAQWVADVDMMVRLPPDAFVPPPQSVVRRGRIRTPRGTTLASAVFPDGEADGGGIRTTPQDAARVAEATGRAGIAGPSRDRGRPAGGDVECGGVRSVGTVTLSH